MRAAHGGPGGPGLWTSGTVHGGPHPPFFLLLRLLVHRVHPWCIGGVRTPCASPAVRPAGGAQRHLSGAPSSSYSPSTPLRARWGHKGSCFASGKATTAPQWPGGSSSLAVVRHTRGQALIKADLSSMSTPSAPARRAWSRPWLMAPQRRPGPNKGSAAAALVKRASRAQGGPFPCDSSRQGPNKGGADDLSSRRSPLGGGTRGGTPVGLR